MARIIRIISVIASCVFCAGLIWCSNIQNQMGVYICIGGCLASFLINMLVTAHENAKALEAQQKQLEQEEKEKAEE